MITLRTFIEQEQPRINAALAEAAAELGMSKTTLWRRMKQYGIRDRFEG